MADKKKVFDDVSSDEYEVSEPEEVVVKPDTPKATQPPTTRHADPNEEGDAEEEAAFKPVEKFVSAEKKAPLGREIKTSVRAPQREEQSSEEEEEEERNNNESEEQEEEEDEDEEEEGEEDAPLNTGAPLPTVLEPEFREDVRDLYLNDEKDPFLLHEILQENDRSFDISRYFFPRFNEQLLNFYTDPKQTLRRRKVEPPNCIEIFVAYIIAADLRFVLYFFMLLVSIVFTIVSLAISQLDLPDRGCYTYFGYKENCDNSIYTTSVGFLECTNIKTRLQAGAAFSIIGLIVQVFCFISCWLMIFCLPFKIGRKKRPAKSKGDFDRASQISLASMDNWMKETKVVAGKSRYIIGGIGASNMLFLLIPWACVAGIYSSRYCEDKETERTTVYGAGFALNVTAWALNAFGIFVLMITPTSLI